MKLFLKTSYKLYELSGPLIQVPSLMATGLRSTVDVLLATHDECVSNCCEWLERLCSVYTCIRLLDF